MAAISNSSPLILYARIGRLSLLQAAFGELVIPPAVHAEVAGAAGRAGADEVAGAAWIRVQHLTQSRIGRDLMAGLGPGEAEAIALAIEIGGILPVLVDDADARREARRHGLAVLGSAGALQVAKSAGAIVAVRPLLDELRSAGLFLTDRVYDEVLRLTQET